MDCNTLNTITVVLGICLGISEILPHVSLAQCNSVIDIMLLIVKKGNCRNTVQEANAEFSENTHQFTTTVQTLKDEIILDLRKELDALKTVRRSFEMQKITE